MGLETLLFSDSLVVAGYFAEKTADQTIWPRSAGIAPDY
jgi:hypothetical protein